MRQHTRLTVAATLATVASASAAAFLTASAAHADAGRHDRADSHGAVATVRAAIAQYRDPAAAIAAGYVRVSDCETSPAGGMGFHYLNPELIDPSRPVDPAHPTVLLYGPDGDSGLRLLGAEFLQPDVGQPTPTLAGEPFDGPMPGHSPGMPVHYDLHVWTEVANPAGVFAPWNPKVTC
jgi:hypothetical protein